MSRLNPGEFVARIQERFDTPRPWWFRLGTFKPVLVPSLVAIAVLVTVSFFLWYSSPEPSAVRWMGATATVTVFVQHEADVSVLQGGRIEAGDKAMFEVMLPPGKRGFVALLALEKDGAVKPVLPSSDDDMAYEVTGTFRLPGAVTSIAGDPSTRLLLVTREEPFAVRDLMARMRELEVGSPVDGLVREVEIGGAP